MRARDTREGERAAQSTHPYLTPSVTGSDSWSVRSSRWYGSESSTDVHTHARPLPAGTVRLSRGKWVSPAEANDQQRRVQ